MENQTEQAVEATAEESEETREEVPFRDSATEEERYLRSCEVMYAEAAHRVIFYKVLAVVADVHDEDEIAQAVYEFPEMKLNVRTPRFYLESLYDAGALDRTERQDAQSTPSTLPAPSRASEDDVEAVSPAASDVADLGEQGQDGEETVQGNGRKKYVYELNPVGERLVRDLAPAHRLDSLLASEPDLADAFVHLLGYCRTPRTRQEVEQELKDRSFTVSLQLSSTYYLDRLEAAGGLVWDGGWKTTAEGEEYETAHRTQG